MFKVRDLAYAVMPPFLQNRCISYYGKNIKKQRFNKSYYRLLEQLSKTQYYSYDELIAYQDEKLCELIKYSYNNVPYYRRIFDERKLSPADIKGGRDLFKLPIIHKSEIRNNFSEFISKEYSKKRLKVGHTSGTTGSPFEILWDYHIELINNVMLWRHRGWGGFKFGDKYATLLGQTIVPLKNQNPPFHRVNNPWNQYLFSSFHLTDHNIVAYFEVFDKHNIRFLEAYPSTAFILAQFLARNKLFYKLNAVFTSSETLLPFQRDLIEQRFQCKVFDYYGSAERVMFSGECDKHEGHHLCLEYGITEILDDDGDSLEPGQYGKTVCTGLHNYGMPLIRYEIGDICSLSTRGCSCGRGLPLLGPITTKAEDIVVLSDGRLISSSVLTHPFKPLRHIEKSQIIQNDYDAIIVKIVKKYGYSDKDTEVLLDGLSQRLGTSVTFSIEFVENIPLGPNGKYRWVISKVPLPQGSHQQLHNLYSD